MNKGIQQGFTLLELLVVLGIVAVLASIAAPDLGLPVNTKRVNETANKVQSALTAARTEAVMRARVVSVQGLNNGDWNTGLETFVDASGAGAEAFENGSDTRLNTYALGNESISISVANGSAGVLSFNNLGGLTAAVGVAILICHSDTRVDGVRLTLNAVGRVTREEEVSCAAP